MTTAVALFGPNTPAVVPAYLQNNPVAKQLQEQTEGGLQGSKINRISLRSGKFRFSVGGTEVGVHRGEYLDVVVVMANPHVGRLFYAAGFSDESKGERPDCYSIDGIKPDAKARTPQNPVCATCPKNAENSHPSGRGRACAFKKRVIVVDPTAIDGRAFALDVNALSMFAEDEPAQRLFNFKSYIEALKANGLIVPAVVTRLTFDEEESVPKLFFTPVRALTQEEWNKVEVAVKNPELLAMLDEVSDQGPGPAAPVAPPPAQVAAPAQPAPLGPPLTNPAEMNPPAAAAPAHQPVARRQRGRPPAAATPPAAAPAMPQTAPAAPQNAAPVAPANGGFAFGGAAPTAAAAVATPPPAQVVNPAPAAPPAGGFSINVEDLNL